MPNNGWKAIAPSSAPSSAPSAPSIVAVSARRIIASPMASPQGTSSAEAKMTREIDGDGPLHTKPSQMITIDQERSALLGVIEELSAQHLGRHGI